MRMFPRPLRALFLTLALTAAMPVLLGSALAQSAGEKKALTIDDYSRWRSISGMELSADGRWVAFSYERGDPASDDTLYVKQVEGETLYEVPLASSPDFSRDSRWVAYQVGTPHEQAEKLREGRKPVPRHAELMDLATGEKVRWEDVTSYGFDRGSHVLAVKKRKADREAEHDGTGLILRWLATGAEELLGSVGSFAFNKPGTWLAYTVDAPDRDGNGLYLLALEEGRRRAADNDKKDYTGLSWEEEGRAVAVLKGAEKEGLQKKEHSLVAVLDFERDRPRTVRYTPSAETGFPEGFVISAYGDLTWSEDLETVFVGIQEQEEELPEVDEEDLSNVEVWHVKDDRLQSVQKIRARRDERRTFASAVHLDEGRFVRLADKTMEEVQFTRDGSRAIGVDDRAYVSDWREYRADVYRVDISDGGRELLFEGLKRPWWLMPDSESFVYWKEGHYWLYDLERGSDINLTASAPVSFEDTTFDRPGTVPPFGRSPDMTADEENLVLQHRFDLYVQPLEGDEARNLTRGHGTENEIELRYIRLDPEERFIDLDEPMLLSAYGQWTKKAGFFRLEPGRRGGLEELVYEDASFGRRIQKAEEADRLLYTRETFSEFPDYYVSGLDFTDPVQVTDAIPWQQEYIWGHTELIDYTNLDGVRLQAVLMVPETYEQGQKLPMLVDFYEKNSQNLNRYPRTVYRDTPMFSKYMSQGYLVLLPDIHFRTRTTHSDMQECIHAALDEVIRLGFVDPERVGLHGHSFSGQGSAYISTHSDRFAAICYGAGATDLVADFNQLWKSAGTNQHRYDTYGQGRFGTNIFDDLQLYIDQSAVFHARDMDTPLLIMHGTADGSVEWLQAVEFYNALRYNDRDVIFLSYPDEPHHLRRHANRVDFQHRMEDFYGHHLKGDPAPEWMTEGVPYLEREKHGREYPRPAVPDTAAGSGGH
ncbi:MAG: prolyl oligopeptidase family serine peptidase [bacterium]